MWYRAKRRALSVLGLSVVFGATLRAGGISSRFAELRISDLRPGRVYTGSTDILGTEYLVDNNTDVPLHFTMVLRIPEPSELQPEYQAIPNLSWITFKKAYFTVPPGKSAGTDFYVSVPTDTAHLGKKYQVQMGINTFGGGSFVQMGLMGRTLLSVSDHDVPWDKSDLKLRKFSAQLSVDPPALFGVLPPVSKWVDFTAVFGAPVRVKNEGDYPLRCRVELASVEEAFVAPPEGFDPLPLGVHVKIRSRRLVVPPHSARDVDGAVRVAKSPAARKGGWYAVLRVVSEKSPGEVEGYARLFLKGAP